MKPEIKCRRVAVSLNRIEVSALADLYYSMRNRRLARAAMLKVIEAWNEQVKKGGAS